MNNRLADAAMVVMSSHFKNCVHCCSRFVSIILNGLQGLFIFLSYTANSKVLKLYRGLRNKGDVIATSAKTQSERTNPSRRQIKWLLLAKNNKMKTSRTRVILMRFIFVYDDYIWNLKCLQTKQDYKRNQHKASIVHSRAIVHEVAMYSWIWMSHYYSKMTPRWHDFDYVLLDILNV